MCNQQEDWWQSLLIARARGDQPSIHTSVAHDISRELGLLLYTRWHLGSRSLIAISCWIIWSSHQLCKWSGKPYLLLWPSHWCDDRDIQTWPYIVQMYQNSKNALSRSQLLKVIMWHTYVDSTTIQTEAIECISNHAAMWVKKVTNSRIRKSWFVRQYQPLQLTCRHKFCLYSS